MFKFPFLYFQYSQWKVDCLVLRPIIKCIESFIDLSTEFAFCIFLAYLGNHKTGNNFVPKCLRHARIIMLVVSYAINAYTQDLEKLNHCEETQSSFL